ncbi:MAG TPA: hypothetical protein DD734_03425 [Firmicutes bacterium]|nr:hypothetical protein [Bacillota bacterium]
MTNEEYYETHNKLMIIAQAVLQLDLDEFLTRITNAEAIGPMVDPTFYKETAGKMKQTRIIAEAARAFQSTATNVLNKLKGDVENEPCSVDRATN